MKRNVTMQDVAEEAKVSAAVVSRVLNNQPAVKLATRQRVQAVIQRLGYQPDTRGRGANPGARRRQTRHRRVLLSMLNSDLSRIAPVYLGLLGGIQEELRAHGYALELKADSGDQAGAAAGPVGIDGAIILGDPARPGIAPLTTQIPCVQVMGQLAATGICDHVTYDNAAIGPLAAQYLLARGHRRAGIVRYDYSNSLFDVRQDTFAEAMAAGGGSSLELPLDAAGGGWSFDTAIERLQAEGITACYSVADIITSFFCRDLQRHGLALGREVEMVSTNADLPYLRPLSPLPAVIDLHGQEVGRRAVRQLLWRLDHPRQLRETVLLNVSLIEPAELEKQLWASTPEDLSTPHA